MDGSIFVTLSSQIHLDLMHPSFWVEFSDDLGYSSLFNYINYYILLNAELET